MSVKLKPVRDQVIVITGASSGIGLTTARMAAERGARLVLVARNEGALRQLEAELNRKGKRTVSVVADVGYEGAAHRIANTASSISADSTPGSMGPAWVFMADCSM